MIKQMTEHSNINEGNLSNIQDSKEESSKDTCFITRIVEHNVQFLIPKKFFQKTEAHPLLTWLLVLEKILKHAIYNIFKEVESILSSSFSILAHVKT